MKIYGQNDGLMSFFDIVAFFRLRAHAITAHNIKLPYIFQFVMEEMGGGDGDGDDDDDVA